MKCFVLQFCTVRTDNHIFIYLFVFKQLPCLEPSSSPNLFSIQNRICRTLPPLQEDDSRLCTLLHAEHVAGRFSATHDAAQYDFHAQKVGSNAVSQDCRSRGADDNLHRPEEGKTERPLESRCPSSTVASPGKVFVRGDPRLLVPHV